MGTQVSPGIRITEKDLTLGVGQVALTEGALAGYFRWGPVDKVQTVSSEEGLVTSFFKPDTNAANYFFTAANFLGYSNTLRIVRVVNANTALNATSGNTTGTGTVSVNTSSNVCTGSGTAFTSELSEGQSVEIAGEVLVVGSITNATHLTFTSVPTAAASANVFSYYGEYIKNDDHYDTDFSSGQGAFGAWAAKYPGSLGNSLRVEICGSSNAYFTNSTSGLSGTISQSSGSTTVTGTSTSFATELQVGDIITANSERRSVTAITNSTQLTVNSAFSGALTSSTFTREWKYASLFDTAPGTSDYAEDRGGSKDELHLVVIDEDGVFTGTPNTVLERYGYLSKASDAKTEAGASNYYKDVINRKSAYIWWSDTPSVGTNWGNTAAGITFTAPLLITGNSLRGGVDGGTLANADLIRGYDLFRDEGVEFSFVLGANSNSTVATHIINNVAEERLYAIAFLSPEYADVVDNSGNEVTDVVAFRNALPASSYAVLDSGWKYQYDKYNDVYRYVPLNGDTAGCCVRADLQGEPWFSPAGFSRGQIKNVIKLAFNPKQSQRDDLYRSGVNPVITEPGRGTVLFGDKTLLDRPSAFDRINVRRLFIALEKSIANAAKSQLFEQNDDFTRQQFINLVEPYLRSVKARRGLTDYLVKCDSENNPQDAIDRNEFRADIYVKPVRSINFIQLNFVAVRSDVAFTEVITNLT